MPAALLAALLAVQTPTATFRAVEEAWTARDAGAYLALWDFETPESEAAERAFVEDRLRRDARLRMHVPEPSAIPLGTRRIGSHGELVTIDEPWGQVEQLLFRIEARAGGWSVVSRQVVGEIGGLAHLSLDPGGLRVAGHVLRLPDFELEMRTGTLFTSPATLGPTVLVFAGKGRVRFRPHLAREREQLRRYAGRPEMDRPVSLAFVRLNTGDLERLVSGPALAPDAAAQARWPAARRFYQQHAESAFTLDSAIAGSPWWIIPPPGDTLVIFDQKDGPLTLSVSTGRAEGISLFDRGRRRQICLYPEQGRPREIDEDDGRTVDVRHQDVRVKIDPYTDRLEGETRLRLGLLGPVGNVRLRLNEALRLESVTSGEGRRHLFFRVRNQGNVMVALSANRGPEELTLTLRYSGTLRPPPFEREHAHPVDQAPAFDREAMALGDSVTVYSQPSAWYPQADVDDFATATVEVELPSGWAAVTAGHREVLPQPSGATVTRHDVRQPVKHLVLAVGRLLEAGRIEESGVTLTAFANARLKNDARSMLEMAGRILRVLVEEFGPSPYDTLQLVLMEAANPGGHSPPGLVLLVRRPLALRAVYDDPANFVEVPGFFLAHELAHQWWGDGVAGRSYHDRWISEGTAQYAAALWVRRSRGLGEFREVMRDMADWALRKTSAGPLDLGHRVGHLDEDPKLFRAVVYDKGAWVLHMLSGIVGQSAFREGLIAYQRVPRFGKAATTDLRASLEAASGLDLARYFEAWVYGTELPTLSLARHQEAVPGGFRTTVTVTARDLPAAVPLQVTLRLVGDDVQTHAETLGPEGGRWEYVTSAPPRKVEINDDLGLLARRDD